MMLYNLPQTKQHLELFSRVLDARPVGLTYTSHLPAGTWLPVGTGMLLPHREFSLVAKQLRFEVLS